MSGNKRSSYYDGSCLCITISSEGELNVYSPVDQYSSNGPELGYDIRAIVYIYSSLKGYLLKRIALVNSPSYSVYTGEDNSFTNPVLRLLVESVNTCDNFSARGRSFSKLEGLLGLSSSGLDCQGIINGHGDTTRLELLKELIGSEVVDAVDCRKYSEALSFLVSVATPSSATVLVEGCLDTATEYLGENLINWRTVALSYSTGNTVNLTKNLLAFPSIVMHADKLEEYLPFPEFSMYTSIDSTQNIAKACKGLGIDYDTSYLGTYALQSVKYINTLLYTSLECGKYLYGKALDARDSLHYIEPSSLRRGTSDSAGISVKSISATRTTSPVDILGILDGPTDKIKGCFAGTLKIPSSLKTAPQVILEAKATYSDPMYRINCAIGAVGIIVEAHLAVELYKRSNIGKKLGVVESSLASNQVIYKGNIRRYLLKAVKESVSQITYILDKLETGSYHNVSKATRSRMESIVEYFNTTSHNDLLSRCWLFNNTGTQQLLFPASALDRFKLNQYEQLNMIFSPGITLTREQRSLASDNGVCESSSASHALRINTSPVIKVFAMQEVLNNGRIINNSEYIEKLSKGIGMSSLDELAASALAVTLFHPESILPHHTFRDFMLGNSHIESSVFSFSECDSYSSAKWIWDKEVLDSINLEAITNNPGDSYYKLLQKIVSSRLKRFTDMVLAYELKNVVVWSSWGDSTYADRLGPEYTCDMPPRETDPIMFNNHSKLPIMGIVVLSEAAKESMGTIVYGNYSLLDPKDIRFLLEFPLKDFISRDSAVMIKEAILYCLPKLSKVRKQCGFAIGYIDKLLTLVDKITENLSQDRDNTW